VVTKSVTFSPSGRISFATAKPDPKVDTNSKARASEGAHEQQRIDS
jgi:hypothetical protein